MDDPIVEEVRKARDEYARQFDYDLKAICQDLKKQQDASGRKVVSFAEERNQDARVEVEK
jgi:hypothetical protein